MLDWPSYVAELIVYHDFDLIQGLIPTIGLEADLRGIYDENGSLNFYEYTTNVDYDETLETGINEWYLQEGANMLPKYSQEKIQHFWDWQEHFMDNVLELIPFFGRKEYQANWNNLEGYNNTKGILQSWGNMTWNSGHTGQLSLDEVIITDYFEVDNLNPLFLVDSLGISFIQDAVLEPLFWVDPNMSINPHLGTSWSHVNDSVIRVTIRDDIKWQSDFEGNFTDEYLDAKDVYFTYYCWKNVSNEDLFFSSLEKIKLVDDYTIDFYFDYNTDDPNSYLDYLTYQILPEHYLNQTQLVDGVTPDINHISWAHYKEHLFGTGLFEIGPYTPNDELILTVFDDCWHMDSSVTADTALNWNSRFGDYSDSIEQIRIKWIADRHNQVSEFKVGHLDILGYISDSVSYTHLTLPTN